ncbi:hypothetical protein [Halopseudomonas salegens]|uniref:Uncharacterized protein n=1 Tax=Halopseudomonas salegens TaxID=1434072 RepID=A0A1H2I3Z8_9GAMM|nr:hypothetical protein [Halopseudomonas salegens]SDU38626.1 hypothetical protein SAMN05216210_3523 [Halopseudomonas salegens]
MTFTGALTILGYAVMPYLWLITLLLAVFFALQVVARLRGYRFLQHRKGLSLLLAALTGLSGLLWIPALTHSRLAYVASTFDWVAMLGALLGVTLLAFVLIHPASYLLRKQPVKPD